MNQAASPKQRQLPPDAEKRVIVEARKDGVFAGLTSGLVSAIIGSRFMRFNRNNTIFCGVLTGILSGYFFTKAFADTAIAQLQAEQVRLTVGTEPGAAPGSGSTTALTK